MMVGEIGCERLELRILIGDIAATTRAQADPPVVGFDDRR